MALLALVIAILAIVLGGQLARRIGELEATVRKLVSSQGATARTDVPAERGEIRSPRQPRRSLGGDAPTEPIRPAPALAPSAVSHTSLRPTPRRQAVDALSPAPAAPSPTVAPATDARWKQLELQLMENWTGILGAVVLVAGVTFVGGYTGLRLSPFHRSLMIAGTGSALLFGAFSLRRRDSWHALAQWIRSAGAAVFLLACFGSSAIPGLAWLDGLGPSLAVLLIGIGVNLGVAYRAYEQVVASLHVVLSLLPLIIVPQSTVTLLVATMVAAAGIRLAWRPSWRLHGIVTLSTYAAFHLVWFAQVVQVDPSALARWAGAIAAGVVCALVTARQYGRRAAMSDPPATLDLVAHVASWVFFGVALAGYTPNASLRGALLLATAGAAYLFGRRSRGSSARKLYVADTLLAEGLALWGLVALHTLVFHWLLIPALMFAMSAIFHRLGATADEPVLERSGLYALRLSGMAVFLAGIATLDPTGPLGGQHAATLFAAALFGATYHVYLIRGIPDARAGALGAAEPSATYASGASVSALAAGLLALLGALNLYGAGWMTLAGVQAGVAFLAAARRVGSRSLALGSFLVLVPTFMLAWFDLLSHHPLPASEQIGTHLSGLAIAGPLAIWLAAPSSLGRVYREVAIYTTGLAVIVAEYTLLQPVAPYMPSVAWLVTSLLALDIARRSEGMAGAVLRVAWVALCSFGVGFLFVVVPSEEALGPVRIRMLVDLLALAVLAHEWTLHDSAALDEIPSWRLTRPLALEAMVVLVSALVLLEVPFEWRPLGWAALAPVMALAGGWTMSSRLRLYSMGFFWLASLQLIAMGAESATSAADPVLPPELPGLLAIAVQIAFLVGLSYRLDLKEIELPRAMSGLEIIAVGLAGSSSAALYYPFFLGVGVFFYLQFAAALLTLLWALEAFAVFAVSLVLRESHFRYAALVALGAVLVRLLVFDLSQSNLGVRGMIFIGVGALMLGMNSLYSRYKDRYA